MDSYGDSNDGVHPRMIEIPAAEWERLQADLDALRVARDVLHNRLETTRIERNQLRAALEDAEEWIVIACKSLGFPKEIVVALGHVHAALAAMEVKP